jgi:hypothetical protein
LLKKWLISHAKQMLHEMQTHWPTSKSVESNRNGATMAARDPGERKEAREGYNYDKVETFGLQSLQGQLM